MSKQYIVVHRFGLEDLEEAVNERISKGWKAEGSVSVGHGGYIQAMTHKEEGEFTVKPKDKGKK